MLQSIHDNAKGWVAYAIILLISVPFALWGISSYLGGGNERVVAVVNGEDIGIQAVQSEVAQQKQRLLEMFKQIPPGFDESRMKPSALEGIIEQKLLQQHAKENNYRASAGEVVDVLATIGAFQKDGKFDAETYHQSMAIQGRNESALEEQIRSSVSVNQFRDAISTTAFMPKSEMENYQKLITQKRDAEVYTLAVKDVESEVNVTDEMIQKYYTDNANSFQTQEQVKIVYVELKESELAKTLEPNDADIEEYYNENADNYYEKSKFKASHIRVLKKEGQSAEDLKKKATELHAALASGKETFENIAAIKDLAKVGLFVEQGDAIGFLSPGVMDKAFDDAVFKTKAGEIAELVETELGYEIIKVLEVQQEYQKTLEQAKADIIKDVKADKVGTIFDELSDKMRIASSENDGSLDPVVAETGGKLVTTEWLSRSAPVGIATNPKVLEAAFSDAVLKKGLNSDIIELGDGHIMVLRLAEHNPPAAKPLADVTADIKVQLVQQEAQKKLKEKGEKLLASIKEAKSWAPLGEAASAVVKHADVTREDTTLAPEMIKSLFNATAEAGTPAYAAVNAVNGDYSIIALTAVKEGEATADDATKTQYAGYIGNREQMAVMKALRDNADVTVYADRLNEE